jgi:hypothetical protein
LAASHDRVVLLLDTFDHVSEDTCAWLERWLFEPLRRELAHLLVVAAGRPQCRPFFDRPRLWSSLVTTIDNFTPLTDEDILTHYRRRGVPVSETETSLLQIARLGPARMADIGNWLEQTRRGQS